MEVDHLISANLWGLKFQEYLNRLKLEDDVVAFKFLIAVSQLESLSAKLKKVPKQRLKEKLEEDCNNLLAKIFNDYFNIEETVLAMSNSKLQEALLEMEPQNFTEHKLEMLKKAKKDPNVWAEGLETTYAKFLSVSANPSMLACLLSIL